MNRFFLVLLLCNSVTGFSQNQRLWSSYIGGPSHDIGNSVAASGNAVYVTGSTKSATGIAYQGMQNTLNGTDDAFLLKTDTTGNLLWATYYGGEGIEESMGVYADNAGNIYITGQTTSYTNIATPGTFHQNFIGGQYDIFIAKFDPAGNRLWGTYFGTPGLDRVWAITGDIAGNVYIAGTAFTNGLGFNGFQNSIAGASDAFLARFDASGNLSWATYYGGTGTEFGFGLSVDHQQNIYLAGSTNSTSGIASAGFQNTYNGSMDAMLVKFGSSGNRIWATYYGGADTEHGVGTCSDAAGNVYLAGYTMSANNISAGGMQNVYGGNNEYDSFLVSFDAAGNRRWGTYYGGADSDTYGHLAIDKNNTIFLAGVTRSNTNISSGGFQNNLVGAQNDFLVAFDTSGNRYGATYFNELAGDVGQHVCTGPTGRIYLTGYTQGASPSLAYNGFQSNYGGGSLADGFIACFGSSGPVAVGENAEALQFTVYPNPAGAGVFIQLPEAGILHIFTVTGGLVYQSNVTKGENAIPLATIPAGVYLLEYQTTGGKTARKRISHF